MLLENSFFCQSPMPKASSRFCSRHRPAPKHQGRSAPYATRSDIPEPSVEISREASASIISR